MTEDRHRRARLRVHACGDGGSKKKRRLTVAAVDLKLDGTNNANARF